MNKLERDPLDSGMERTSVAAVDAADLERQRGDLSAGSSLPFLMGALGLLLVLSSILRSEPLDSFLGFAAAAIGVVCGVSSLVAAAVLSRTGVHPDRAHLVGSMAILGAGLSLVLSMAATGSPAMTMYVELLIVVAGAVLRRPPWLVAVEAGLWGMWLSALASVPDTSNLSSWVLAMVSATVIAVAIHAMRTRSLRAVVAALAQAEAEAIEDVLTGLLNRRGLLVVGEEVLALGRRTREPVCCTFIDVDGLKDVNDRLGHERGDEVLLEVARSLRRIIRESDILARWGGDEFVALGLGAGPNITDLENRLVKDLGDTELAGAGLWQPFVSIGRVVHMPWQEETLEEVLEHADQDMYDRRRSRRATEAQDYDL